MTSTIEPTTGLNGVDTDGLFATIGVVRDNPDLAKFQFRTTTRWVSGTYNQTSFDAFHGAGTEHEHAASYVVDADSDRVGLRLDGPSLERRRAGELPSEGIVLGAVQVPADGRPLVFLRDHPTTGGYPVVAVVDVADLGRCAQLRPGDEITFRWRAAPRPEPGGGG